MTDTLPQALGAFKAPGSSLTKLASDLVDVGRGKVSQTVVRNQFPGCDIMRGIRKALQTGVWPHVKAKAGDAPVSGMICIVPDVNTEAREALRSTISRCDSDTHGANSSRAIHDSSVPVVCQVSTPDSQKTGLVTHLSMGGSLSLGTPASQEEVQVAVLSSLAEEGVHVYPVWAAGALGGITGAVCILVNGVPLGILPERGQQVGVPASGAVALAAVRALKRAGAGPVPVDAEVAITQGAEHLGGVPMSDSGPPFVQEFVVRTTACRPIFTFIVLEKDGDTSLAQAAHFRHLAAAAKLNECIPREWGFHIREAVLAGSPGHSDALAYLRSVQGKEAERRAVLEVRQTALSWARQAGGAVSRAVDADTEEVQDGLAVCLVAVRRRVPGGTRAIHVSTHWRLVASEALVEAVKYAVEDAYKGPHPLLEYLGAVGWDAAVVREALRDAAREGDTHCLPSPWSISAESVHVTRGRQTQYARQGFYSIQSAQCIPPMAPVGRQHPLCNLRAFRTVVGSRRARTAAVSSVADLAAREWGAVLRKTAWHLVATGAMEEDMLEAAIQGVVAERLDGVMPLAWSADPREAATCGAPLTTGIMPMHSNDNDAICVLSSALASGAFSEVQSTVVEVRMPRTVPLSTNGTSYFRGVALPPGRVLDQALKADIDLVVQACRDPSSLHGWRYRQPVQESMIPAPFYLRGLVRAEDPRFTDLISAFANKGGCTEVVFRHKAMVERAHAQGMVGGALGPDGLPEVGACFPLDAAVVAYTMVRVLQAVQVTVHAGSIRLAIVVTQVQVTYGAGRVPTRGMAEEATFQVEAVKVLHGEGPEKPVSTAVTLSRAIKPDTGDKFTSPFGQKNTVGRVIPLEEMPYTRSGMVVAVLIDSTAIPTRLLGGTVLDLRTQIITAKAALQFVDTSTGRDVDEDFGGLTASLCPHPLLQHWARTPPTVSSADRGGWVPSSWEMTEGDKEEMRLAAERTPQAFDPDLFRGDGGSAWDILAANTDLVEEVGTEWLHALAQRQALRLPASAYTWMMVPEGMHWDVHGSGPLTGSPVGFGISTLLAMKHLVSMAACNLAPVEAVTHQPPSGITGGGSLRMGRMEGDCLNGQGMAAMLRACYDELSDGTQVLVCSNCGSWHQVPKGDRFECRNAKCVDVHGSSVGFGDVHVLSVPYAFLLFAGPMEGGGAQVAFSTDNGPSAAELVAPFVLKEAERDFRVDREGGGTEAWDGEE